MQKINFNTHLIRNILQINSKLAIWGNLGMPNHTHPKNDSINLKKSLIFICWQKINFIPVLSFLFLEILQRYCKLVVLGNWVAPSYTEPK